MPDCFFLPLAKTMSSARKAQPGQLCPQKRQSRRFDQYHWLVVAAVVFLVAWGGNQFTPLLIMYRADHGFSPLAVNMLLFAYVLGIVPGLFIGGPLSDYFGRKPLLLPAPMVTILGSLLLMIGPDHALLLALGRISCGLALGLGMTVGGSWIKELSTTEISTGEHNGARRAAMSLTSGFITGAGVAGIVAQWGPHPSSLPYVIHIVLVLPVTFILVRVPETVRRQTTPFRLIDDLKIPSAGHRRFIYIIVPLAPWIFGAASAAYAVLPGLVSHQIHYPLVFSALMCFIALGAGLLMQSVAKNIDTAHNSQAVLLAFTLIIIGMVVAAVTSFLLSLPLVLFTAAILGAGYGLALLSGLQEVQKIATDDDLAGLTAVYYSLAYLGFGCPAVMSSLQGNIPAISYPIMFGFGSLAAAICFLWTFKYRKLKSP